MISLANFFMGRDTTYASVLTGVVTANAIETVRRVNELLNRFCAANPTAHARTVNSGWRPPAVNARVPNAAAHSLHMTGQAIDLGDDDGALDAWCMSIAGQAALTAIGLWMEHPSATPRWCHVQTMPPGSGRRCFYP